MTEVKLRLLNCYDNATGPARAAISRAASLIGELSDTDRSLIDHASRPARDQDFLETLTFAAIRSRDRCLATIEAEMGPRAAAKAPRGMVMKADLPEAKSTAQVKQSLNRIKDENGLPAVAVYERQLHIAWPDKEYEVISLATPEDDKHRALAAHFSKIAESTNEATAVSVQAQYEASLKE